MSDDTLTGRAFDVDLGPFVPRLNFLGDGRMRLQATIGPAIVDEVVAIDLTRVRPDLFLVAWTETSGNYVVQVHDHENAVVYNRARLADGNIFEAKGTIRPV